MRKDASLILIVDDTLQDLQVLGSMLKEQGYNIAAVTNGQEALEFVNNKRPDLILLDVMMPDLNGFELFRKLKEQESWEQVPVIFISVLNEVDDKVKGFKLGAVDFVTKPFQKQEVLARVETHLELKQNRERVENYAKRLEKRNCELEQVQAKLNEQLEKGKQLHRQFLPDELPSDDKISTAVYYDLTEKIGGDFYNFIEFNQQLIGYIVDITGHGLDGALLNIFVRETINSFLESKTKADKFQPREILKFIYQKYNQEKFSDDYFICIGLFIVDKITMNLIYSNSGLQFAPLLIKANEIVEFTNRGLPISTAIELEKYDFSQRVVELKPGDKLLLMTDGLIEETFHGRRYGVNKLMEVLEKNIQLPIEALVNKIKNDFTRFTESTSYSDDVTLLGLGYNLDIISRDIIEVPNSFSRLESLKRQVREILQEESIATDKLVMAFHEMLVNAFKHGNREDSDKVVKISVEVTDSYVRLAVEDEGAGFDWGATLRDEEIYENWDDSGRGLKVADLACDSIYYNTVGNKVYLVSLKNK
ncbi:MAG: response regulator [Bacillota bacterium]